MASRSDRILRLAVALAVSALLWVLVPAAASACSVSESTLNAIKSFSGNASAGYVSGSVEWTPAVLPGATSVTYTESMSRQASNLQLTDLTQADQSSGTFSNAKMPSGGYITIDDTYSDTLGGKATQLASGPTIGGGGSGSEGAQIDFNTAACSYHLLIPFAIAAPTAANMAGIPDDSAVDDQVQTPNTAIPSDLILRGSGAVPASGGGTSGSTGAIFDMSSDPTWPLVLDEDAAGRQLRGDPGTASVTWELAPQSASRSSKPKAEKPTSHKPKRHKHRRKGMVRVLGMWSRLSF